MTFTTFVMFDMLNALCCRSADKIVPQMELLANKAFLYSVGGSLIGQVRTLLPPYLIPTIKTRGAQDLQVEHVSGICPSRKMLESRTLFTAT